MCALKVSELTKDLRSLADSVERRLWVASPYIGSWKAVRKILGSAWQKVDVRLLTDKDSGILAQDTIEQFAAHRPVRSLEGLHAKLYIKLRESAPAASQVPDRDHFGDSCNRPLIHEP